MKKVIFLISLVIATIAFESCSTVPLTGRKQFSILPESSLVSLSLDNYRQVLNESNVVKNTTESRMVEEVGLNIAGAVEQFLIDNKLGSRVNDYQWEFTTIQEDVANAWAMPGGKVAVYTGILPITKDEQGLAVVMGHEVAHAVARHGNERMSQGLVQQLGGVALSVALANKPAATQNLFLSAYGVGSNIGVMLPFGRKQESEADEMGLRFMAMAGYNPNNAHTFWERMSKSSGGGAPPEFLSTHPSHETRIKNLKKWAPQAMKYYNPNGPARKAKTTPTPPAGSTPQPETTPTGTIKKPASSGGSTPSKGKVKGKVKTRQSGGN